MNEHEKTRTTPSAEKDASPATEHDHDSGGKTQKLKEHAASEDRTYVELAKNFEIGLELSAPTRDGSLGRLSAYEVLNVVGRGGMGVVVRAFDEQLHRNVAIKLMSSQLTNSPRAKQRFVREARSAATINHPNVITIHAVSEKDGTPFLVMEYVEGRTLQNRIEADAPLDPSDIVRITMQICDGLAAAHRRGIIHRDIKPSNILLEDGIERVKITDFGLARLALENSDLTSMGDLVGTPAYMSPEQVSGEDLDGRSDLFSVGCVMYAMIAGRSPFRRAGAIATARCVKDEPHKPLSGIAPKTPSYLIQIIDRLLEKSPDQRFSSAEDLCDELTKHLPAVNRARSTETTIETRSPALERSQRQTKWLFASLALLVLAGGGMYAFSSLWHDNNPSEAIAADSEQRSTDEQSESSGKLIADPAAAETITVGQEADFESLQQAIEAATPNDIIRVLDDRRYEGPFFIAKADKFAGLQLISEAGATLTSSAPGAVITVAGTPDVRVEGFRIEPGPQTHSVYMHWDVPGCELVNLTFQQAEAAEWASVLLARQCHGKPDAPLIVRNCSFQSVGANSIFIGRDDDPNSLEAAHIVIQDNRFDGPSPHLSLNHAATNVRVERNIFHGGTGINVHLNGKVKSSNIVLNNNSFLQTAPWLQVSGESAVDQGKVINNLILEVPNESATESLAELAGWTIHHNLLEISNATGDSSSIIQTVPDAGVPGRDPASDGFLQPASKGIAATAGAGGSSTQYVGAIGPETD